jgi:LPXTG-motif cell wall-anchored protein
MNIKQLIGLVSLVLGLYLFITANRSADTFGERAKQEVTGDYTERTRNMMIGGVVLIALGGGLLLFKKRDGA